jgi:hypothetical protein
VQENISPVVVFKITSPRVGVAGLETVGSDVCVVISSAAPPGKLVNAAPLIAGKAPVKLAAGKLVNEAPLPLNGLLTIMLPVPSTVVIVLTFNVLTKLTPYFILLSMLNLLI